MSKTLPPKNITRHVTNRGMGWLVRITSKGVVTRKFFGDTTYGDPMSSLGAATYYRNKLRQASTDGRVKARR